MLQAALAGLLTAAAVTGVVALNEVVSPEQALRRLTPVVVGTLDLSAEPGSATFTLSNMAPGDVAVRSITITNGGTLPFRYAMRTAVDEDPAGLATQLRLTVREGVNGECETESGTVIVGRSMPADVAIGSPEWSQQDGDRRLDAGQGEALCFLVELPLSTTNEVGGAAASLTFAFDAEEIRED